MKIDEIKVYEGYWESELLEQVIVTQNPASDFPGFVAFQRVGASRGFGKCQASLIHRTKLDAMRAKAAALAKAEESYSVSLMRVRGQLEALCEQIADEEKAAS